MNLRIESKLTKEELIESTRELLDKGKWYSLPNSFVGRVTGSKVEFSHQGGLVSWPGRGRFTGYIQEIEGKTLISGKLNSKKPAVGIGLMISASILFVFMVSGIDRDEYFGFINALAAFPTMAYAIVTMDHRKIRNTLAALCTGK